MQRHPIRTTLTGLLAVLALLALLPGSTVAGDESPGTISFAASNDTYSAEGKFENWKFTKVDIPNGDLEQGTVEIEIQLASVWEKAEKLAEHLRQADFFHVEKYTTSTLVIDRVKKVGEASYEGVATVDLHGHTNEVPVTFEVTNTSPLQIEGKATLQRTDFGIGEPYDPNKKRSITDDVVIHIDATLP